MDSRTRDNPLVCRCGEKYFRVRAKTSEGVALLTCQQSHNALLLDSRDHWGDVIQDARPPELKCKCNGREFTISLRYHYREDELTVRHIAVSTSCARCHFQRVAISLNIDYSPTDSLVAEPLDYCEDPWLKAKRTSLSALWLPSDNERTIKHILAGQSNHGYLGDLNRNLAPATLNEILERVRSERFADVYVGPIKLASSVPARDSWKHHPVVRISSPTHMMYPTGKRLLYYVEYAEEVFHGGAVVPQPDSFRAFAQDLRAWLFNQYVSERGRNTIDNHSEYQKYRGL